MGVALACLASPAVALAQAAAAPPSNAPVSIGNEYSPYEKQTIADVLHERHAEVDPHPEGKTVEGIDVVPLEVIEKRDPAPSFLNVFHTTTRPWVIDQEVLIRPGQPYRQALVDQTTRNLRDDIQTSLVVVLPIRGSAPDKVRILVIAKDVWSLRLNSDIRIVSGDKLEYMFLQPSEWNLAGTHHNAGLQFIYYPLSYSLGGTYTIPRFLGSWVDLHADVNVFVNSKTKQTEGSFGSLSAIQPLYSPLTEWAWGVQGTWANEVVRGYTNAELGCHVAGYVETFSCDPTATVAANQLIPLQYRAIVVLANAYVTRSFGFKYKNDITFGAEASEYKYDTFDLSAYDPAAAAAFQSEIIPVGDRRFNPFVQWESYTSDFMRVLDFETLGLQEDYRIGHDVLLKVYPVAKALGSSRNFFGTSASAYYTLPLSNGMMRVGAEGIVEGNDDGVSDALLETKERVITPRTAIGRLLFDGDQIFRPRDFLNRRSYLGGEARLRGYPTHYLYGRNVVAYNLEFRTRPVEIFTLQVGGVAFWDTGDAFDEFSQMSLKHGAGFGLRMLFPQLDRYVLRIDMGFPVVIHEPRPIGTNPYEIVLTFQQAFSIPTPSNGTIFTTR